MAIRDTSSYDETIPFSDTDKQIHLTTAIEQNFTVPGTSSQKFTLKFGAASDTNLFVGYNVTATIPGANLTTSTSGIEFITPGEKRYAIGGDVISLISPDADAYVGVSIRSIPN